MRQRWQDWVSLILGIWLFISPWVVGFSAVSNAAANAWILGIVVAVVAIIALSTPQLWEEWVNLILGIWLIISPWVVGFSNMAAPTWDSVIVGLIVALVNLWGIVQVQRHRITTA